MANLKVSQLTADTSPTVDDLLYLVDDPSGTPASKKVVLEFIRDLILSSSYLCYQDQKAQNTGGGTFTSGAWRTRTLNTEVSDIGGYGTLSSNQITLAAGIYRIKASAPAFAVDRHQTRLQNTTAGTTILPGTSAYNSVGGGGMTRSEIDGVFTIVAAQALEFQHRCNTTRATDGFGVESNFTTEVYAIVELWKIG